MPDRELTPAEIKALGLCKTHEKVLNEHRLIITLQAGREAAEAIQKGEVEGGLFRTLCVNYNPKSEKYEVTFTVQEFWKYLHFVLAHVGLTMLIDGGLKTFDGLYISNEYLREVDK